MGATALAKRGRPTAFNNKLAAKMLELATSGATDVEIAAACSIPLGTFLNWKNTKADFLAALRECKAIADELVVASLFSRAMGYSHPAVKILSTKEGIEVVPYTEHYPPDPTSMIFWLKNRQPKKWRDAQRLEVDNVSKQDPLPTPQQALKILSEDYALLPAIDVKIEEL
jgi:hypothetical protein